MVYVLSWPLMLRYFMVLGFVSEQLIPMCGLTELEHMLNPDTTLDKFIFFIENGWEHSHRLTTVVSFGTLVVLISMRMIKGLFKNYWFIYRIPEVLIVVIVATGKLIPSLVSRETNTEEHF